MFLIVTLRFTKYPETRYSKAMLETVSIQVVTELLIASRILAQQNPCCPRLLGNIFLQTT